MSVSESDMDTDNDSEKDLEGLRAIKQAMEGNAILAPHCSKYTSTEITQTVKIAEYSKIEYALALNKQCDEKLQRLEKVLEQRLYECRHKLLNVRGQKVSDNDRRESFRYINCGRPYFKDKENFAAPDNSDTLLMAKNDMYDFSTITSVPGWTMRDKTQLWNQIEKMTKSMKRKELQSKISALKRDAKQKKQNEKAAIEKKIEGIKKKLSKISKKTLHKLALPIDQEYDWEEVTHSLDRRHSAEEYRALWKLYLHPSINKSNWDKTEHQLLQKIAHENGLHGWEKIAEQMGNNRTGYQCFVYFRTNMNNTFTGKKWTSEEVAYLLRLIEYYKEDDYIPWVKVAALMENRTKIQIYNKYSRLLEQRKGRFLLEEDTVILTCADDFGTDFKRMSQFLPGRSMSQIRVRYQALMKKRVSTVWTVEEDRKLLQLLTNQDSSANYASITKYFPGKDRIHIRARYVTLVKWMRRNPNADITKAPRRGARRLGHGRASDNLTVAIESLRTRIQTEAQQKKTNRINIDSSEEAIEDGIVATLLNEAVYNDENIMYDCNESGDQSIPRNYSDVISEIVQDMDESDLQRILLILRASLNREHFHNRQSNGCSKLNKTDEGVSTCIVKVKSYSKQNKIKSIELNETPDIWGHHKFKTPQYVLPPQYATITGCRKLMTYVASKEQDNGSPLNFSVLGRRNVIFRDQLDLVMERFNILFLWPMLLSNEGPNLSDIFNINLSSTTLDPRDPEILTHSDNIPPEGEKKRNKKNKRRREETSNSDTIEDLTVEKSPIVYKNNLNTQSVLDSEDADPSNCIEINIKDDKYCFSFKHL